MKKNRKSIILICFFLLLIVDLFAGDGRDDKDIKKINKSDFKLFTIQGDFIALDMNLDEVVNFLGEPGEIVVRENPYNKSLDRIMYKYDTGIKFIVSRGTKSIDYIVSSTDKFFLPRKICVGDSLSLVVEKYPLYNELPNGDLSLQYFTDDETLRELYILIEVLDGFISKIILGVAVDI